MSSRSAPSSTIRAPAARRRPARDRRRAAREQAVAGERVGRHVEDAHHERPLAPARRSAGRSASARRATSGRWLGLGGRVAGHRASSPRVAQQRVVDQRRRGRRRRDRASRRRRPDRGAPASARSRRRADVRLGDGSTPVRRVAPTRQRAASSSAGSARGRSTAVAMIRAPASAADAASAAMTPSTSLSAIDAVTRVTADRASPREVRPQVVEGDGERRRAGRVVGPVEQHVAPVDVAAAPGDPARSRAAYPRGGRRRRPGRCPPPSSASRTASATAAFAAWCRPRSPTRVGPSRGSSTVDARRVPAEDRRRRDLGERRRRPAAPGGG